MLPEQPDIVLLDNMPPTCCAKPSPSAMPAVNRRSWKPRGGVNLQTVRAIAETGVERISVGALTHSAVSLDVALDWQ